jgi:Flp pilus assembly protein TadD
MSGLNQNPVNQTRKEDVGNLVEAGLARCTDRRFPEARTLFLRVKELDPAQPMGEIGLGSVCFSEGDFATAIGHYRSALKLNPCSAYAYALLGESQIFQREHANARVSLRRASELDPRGPYGHLAQNLLRFLESLAMCDSAQRIDDYEN